MFTAIVDDTADEMVLYSRLLSTSLQKNMCGIVGILAQNPVASDLYDSLIHLQHRGQDAAGIMTCDRYFHSHIDQGLVREIFNQDTMQKLSGNTGIAHVRYPTAGGFSRDEAQPFRVASPYGISLAHNGNLTNHQALIDYLQVERRRHLNTTSDSECLIHLFADGFHQQPITVDSAEFFEQICQAVSALQAQVEGSYSVVSNIVGKGLIAFRDPHGVRPLVMGRRGQDIILASESTPFFSLGFDCVGDIEPGEVVFVDQAGQVFRRVLTQKDFHPCVFEYVYFARPDAVLNDVSVYRSRLRMGENLAKLWRQQYPDKQPDVVIPVPFTSNTSALSFAKVLGVPYSEGLYKNPFIGRTFIMPENEVRKRSVRYKLTPQMTEIKDKTVLLLDDSIVRGTTSREIVRMLRECGAKAVYFVSACPPVKYPCYYGIDIPTQEELIANGKTTAEIEAYLGVDALLYQSEEDLVEAVARKGKYHIDSPCLACMNGEYRCGQGGVA